MRCFPRAYLARKDPKEIVVSMDYLVVLDNVRWLYMRGAVCDSIISCRFQLVAMV